jgi:PhzF family phenazine biosynthesis protein
MRQWTIDAFAGQPFRGNPACVVEPFAVWPDAGWMQRLAQENNQAETAFLLRTADPSRFGLRWFTPTTEVPLCGHATLASAHALSVELGVKGGFIFDTLSGPLTVEPGDGGYRMSLPADEARPLPIWPGLTNVLGLEPKDTWVGPFVLAMLDDETAVRRLKLDTAAVMTIDGGAGWGPGHLAVSAIADPESPHDIVTRFFGPGSGIPEDPTTGSLYCMLGPFFAARLGLSTVRFHQAFPGRGGDVIVEPRDDRVLLHGRAVTVIESRLRI